MSEKEMEMTIKEMKVTYDTKIQELNDLVEKVQIQEKWRLKVIAKFDRVFEILRSDSDRISTLEESLLEFNDRKRPPDPSPPHKRQK